MTAWLAASGVACLGTGCHAGPHAAPSEGRTTERSKPPAVDPVTAHFPDYEPKRTPDTVADYRPSLRPRLAQLPPARLASFAELLKTLAELKALAAHHPGEWHQGQLPLGGEPRQYVPSDEELLVFAVGERIRAIVEDTPPEQLAAHLDATGVKTAWIEYPRFIVYHADVMGSGRFFHAKAPTVTRVRLRR